MCLGLRLYFGKISQYTKESQFLNFLFHGKIHVENHLHTYIMEVLVCLSHGTFYISTSLYRRFHFLFSKQKTPIKLEGSLLLKILLKESKMFLSRYFYEEELAHWAIFIHLPMLFEIICSQTFLWIQKQKSFIFLIQFYLQIFLIQPLSFIIHKHNASKQVRCFQQLFILLRAYFHCVNFTNIETFNLCFLHFQLFQWGNYYIKSYLHYDLKQLNGFYQANDYHQIILFSQIIFIYLNCILILADFSLNHNFHFLIFIQFQATLLSQFNCQYLSFMIFQQLTNLQMKQLFFSFFTFHL